MILAAMARTPETHYAKGPGGDIAYQVVGDGPIDLVIVPGWVSHVDLLGQDPGWSKFIAEFASFARIIQYDKLGTGASDPIVEVPTLESRADELHAVLDAAGSDRPAFFGLSQGGPISVMFAASYPQRVQALILFGTFVSGSPEDDGSPGRAEWITLLNRVRESVQPLGRGQHDRLGGAQFQSQPKRQTGRRRVRTCIDEPQNGPAGLGGASSSDERPRHLEQRSCAHAGAASQR